MKKKLFIFVLLVLAILCGARIFLLNRKYPSAENMVYTKNEPVDFKNVEFTLKNASIIKGETYGGLFKNEIDNFGDCYAIVADISLENKGSQIQEVDLSSIIFESGAWKNAIHLMAFLELNSEMEEISTHPQIGGGETLDIKLATVILPQHVKNKTWDDLNERDFYLTLSLYPQKKMIRLQ